MGRTRKPIEEKTVRVQENPVTHVLERTVLDAPQRAFERAVEALDRAMCAVPTAAGSSPWYEIAETAASFLIGLEDGAYSQTARWPEPLGTLARLYRTLGAADRFQFVMKLRARLREMTPPSRTDRDG